MEKEFFKYVTIPVTILIILMFLCSCSVATPATKEQHEYFRATEIYLYSIETRLDINLAEIKGSIVDNYFNAKKAIANNDSTAYNNYYIAAETLLDYLEEEYNIVDRINDDTEVDYLKAINNLNK